MISISESEEGRLRIRLLFHRPRAHHRNARRRSTERSGCLEAPTPTQPRAGADNTRRRAGNETRGGRAERVCRRQENRAGAHRGRERGNRAGVRNRHVRPRRTGSHRGGLLARAQRDSEQGRSNHRGCPPRRRRWSSVFRRCRCAGRDARCGAPRGVGEARVDPGVAEIIIASGCRHLCRAGGRSSPRGPPRRARNLPSSFPRPYRRERRGILGGRSSCRRKRRDIERTGLRSGVGANDSGAPARTREGDGGSRADVFATGSYGTSSLSLIRCRFDS